MVTGSGREYVTNRWQDGQSLLDTAFHEPRTLSRLVVMRPRVSASEAVTLALDSSKRNCEANRMIDPLWGDRLAASAKHTEVNGTSLTHVVFEFIKRDSERLKRLAWTNLVGYRRNIERHLGCLG